MRLVYASVLGSIGVVVPHLVASEAGGGPEHLPVIGMGFSVDVGGDVDVTSTPR
jgi:hypothetical protein